MYFNFSFILIGTVFLLLYIIIDFVRHQTRNILRRITFYSLIFYMLVVAQLTTGGIIVPPQKELAANFQFIPFYFIGDLFSMYKLNGLDWFFWNSFKLTFYNFIMLMPFGVYLSILYNVKSKLKSLFIIFSVSFTIEFMQFVLSHLGLIMNRGVNIDDIIMNTLGGFVAFIICEYIKRYFFKINAIETKS